MVLATSDDRGQHTNKESDCTRQNTQTNIVEWKTNNTDWEKTNPQTMWETFKHDITKIAKNHAKTLIHKTNMKIRNLEKDRRAIAANRDFNENKEHQTEEALLTNEITHLGCAQAKSKKEIFRAQKNNHREKLEGIWSVMSKSRKPRDPIYQLKIPNSNPLQYKRCTRRMAKLARDYHENLQREGINPLENREMYSQKINELLQEVPDAQKLEELAMSPMNWEANRTHIEKAIHLAKSASAPGMDGCPYKLWKKLKEAHDEAIRKNKPGFDIIDTLTTLFNDIQRHEVDTRMNFSLG